MIEHARGSQRDPDIEERLARCDAWIRDGRVPSSSRVIPVEQSIPAQQRVLPGARALELVRAAHSVALTSCQCRMHYRRCSNPLDVCLILGDAADNWVREGRARRVTIEEAADALRVADEHGLVHLAIYCPEHRVYVVCSCCSCCCHDLQFLTLCGRGDLIARSEYLAKTDSDGCSHCRACVDRCVFGARTVRERRMVFRSESCYGCGLCATVCSVGVTAMVRRTE